MKITRENIREYLFNEPEVELNVEPQIRIILPVEEFSEYTKEELLEQVKEALPYYNVSDIIDDCTEEEGLLIFSADLSDYSYFIHQMIMSTQSEWQSVWTDQGWGGCIRHYLKLDYSWLNVPEDKKEMIIEEIRDFTDEYEAQYDDVNEVPYRFSEIEIDDRKKEIRVYIEETE